MKWERKSEKKLVFLLLSAMIIAMLTAGCGKQTRDFAQDKEILSSLGKMYAGGGEFTENIDKMGGEGTAEYTNRAIQIYCG